VPAKRILIATWPFGECGREPLDLLEATGWDLVFNPHGRRLTAADVEELLEGVDAVIAGTEPYHTEVLARFVPRLRHIARVGIGLDNLDVAACRKLGISVSYTPEAPSQAVAELTVAQILNLCRGIPQSDRSVRDGTWNRFIGRLVSELTIGIVGLGRIGKRVCRLLEPFQPRILAVEIEPDREFCRTHGIEIADKQTLLTESDLVTLHIPATSENRGYISGSELKKLKGGAFLINTSRGPVIEEGELVRYLKSGKLGGVALDVFQNEPYTGPLARSDATILTAHIGASARRSRFDMELQAAEDAIESLSGRETRSPAPEGRL